jgi:heme A synthase
VSQEGKDGWITVHGIVADASWVLSLITVGYAFFTLRRHFPVLIRLAVALFAVTLLQTGIGHLITEAGVDWLIAVHVPLAFVVFAVAGYLSVWAVRVRHQLNTGQLERAAKVGATPNADVHDVVRPSTHPSGSGVTEGDEEAKPRSD